MAIGKNWTYHVQAGFDRYVEKVRVVRRVPVASDLGYELQGPLGESRLVWEGNKLLASETANARFIPPIPLVLSRGKSTVWHGRIGWLDKVQRANADLRQHPARLDLGGSEYIATESILTIRLPRHTIELRSWFAPGKGIVQQEQRTDSMLLLSAQTVAGG